MVAARVYLPVLAVRLPAPVPDDHAGRMTMKLAVQIAGALGHPSKMPGFSYGISAQLCNVGSKLRGVPGSVCSGCYAMTDWYRSWRPLLEGHARRERGLRHPRWVEAMVHMIRAKCTGEHAYFRWHDSGDLRGLWHLQNIVVPPELAHLPTSTVSSLSRYRSGVAIVDGRGSVECRAVEARDNKCGNCRACWDPRVTTVNYPQH